MQCYFLEGALHIAIQKILTSFFGQEEPVLFLLITVFQML